MLAGFQCLERELGVHVMPRGDEHGIDVLVLQYFFVIRGAVLGIIIFSELLGGGAVLGNHGAQMELSAEFF